MKNFVLNALNVLAWLFEILCGAMAVILVLSVFITATNMKSLAKTMYIENNVGNNIAVIYITLFLVAAMFAVMVWTINSVRLVVKNVKHEIYFDKANLNLLHQTLISFSIFTVLAIIESIFTGIAGSSWNMTTVFRAKFDFTDALFSVIVLGIIYVIYLVFKNGLQLQEESNKII